LNVGLRVLWTTFTNGGYRGQNHQTSMGPPNDCFDFPKRTLAAVYEYMGCLDDLIDALRSLALTRCSEMRRERRESSELPISYTSPAPCHLHAALKLGSSSAAPNSDPRNRVWVAWRKSRTRGLSRRVAGGLSSLTQISAADGPPSPWHRRSWAPPRRIGRDGWLILRFQLARSNRNLLMRGPIR
jgi:hypothetical protein